jgi:hypothetical protein
MLRNASLSVFLPFLVCVCANGAALAQSLAYNLRMTFASKTGNHLSDIDVTITSGAGGPILSVRTEGPVLFVRLPAGRYQIGAQTRHITETRNIQVPAHGAADLRFYWEDPVRHGVLRICTSCPNTAHP